MALLEPGEWESSCKGKELSLQLQPESLMSKLCLIKVQCVFETIQCWCHSSFPSSLSLSFSILMSIKLASIISNVFSCSMSPLLLVLSAAHVVERCSPSFWKRKNCMHLFKSHFLLINLPVLSLFLRPSLHFPSSLEN